MSFYHDPIFRSILYGLLPLFVRRLSSNERETKSQFEAKNEPPLNLVNEGILRKCKGLKVGFIAVSDSALTPSFLASCQILGIRGQLFDPRDQSFFKDVENFGCDFLIVRPEYKTLLIRNIFDEKIRTLRQFTKIKIYPNDVELMIYESKRDLKNFLEFHSIPHPRTSIFYREEDALEFLNNTVFPLIFKSNKGAASSGVEIIRSYDQAIRFTKHLFRSRYFGKRVSDLRDFDYGYVLFQEFLPDVKEFRVIKIGNSWFGHEKMSAQGSLFMSGSGLNKWTPPSIELLNFCNRISIENNFEIMCFDIFKTCDGRFLVNELQTWFGSYNDSQMYIDDAPGRFLNISDQWVFQEGYFNVYQSLLLRLVELSQIFKGNHND